ncbi:hypothetical protein TNCT_96951 [Trichonephila clavata]|uniref:Uncharacterized protein n=1 Tax=Trichonephila clavata TaxID=2740835 RepID=A0A8X6G4V7_TRICU|nr:hypothetical protein TNCT_96951 [Trichonephila clavata]
MSVITVLLFCLSQIAHIYAQADVVAGVPDSRQLKPKISRGSGTGVISFGYAVVVLLAFVFFIGVFIMIVYYKRAKGIRNKEKTLFLTSY